MRTPLSNIKPSLINEQIYSQSDLSDLKQSLTTNGQLEPLVVNEELEIISGHRRYYSMVQLGWEECEIRKEKYDNDTVALIEHNRHRVKSVNDIVNESRYLEKELKEKFGGRGKRNDLNGNGGRYVVVEQIADKLGLGLSKLKQIKTISNYEPELIHKIDKKEISVNQAYNIVKEKHFKTKSKPQNGHFSKKFRSLLNEYKPSEEEIFEVLSQTHPYSLNGFGTKVEINHKLKKKRAELVENLEFLKSLDSRELVLYRKLKEFQNNPLKNTESLKSLLWGREDPLDELEPIVELADDTKQFDDIRRLIHSFEWVSSPGRLMRLYVKDKQTDKILGLITIASDISTIGCRDEWIGWDNNMRMNMGKLRHSAVASSIVPVQPFGYNYLGGKLIACMSTSNTIRNLWKQRYGDELVGITTTSLFGSFSMYNGIPLWKKMGSSMGKVLLKPDKEIYDYWNHWLKENHKELYQNSVVGKSSPKQKTLATLFRILGLKISDYYVNQNRGVYYSSFYKNARDFLCNQIPIEELIVDERFNDDYIMKWWKPKAINRFKKLEKSNKLQTADLWYEDMDKELENFKSWLMSRGKKYYSIKNNMVSSDSVDKMFNKAGIDKTKLYKCLITMGRAGLKTKKMKEEWSKENPTRNYCYTVSEFIYKYVAPKGVKHYSVKVEGEDLTHHYLKWTDGSIVDLTAEQFSDYSKVDYSKGYSSGFIGKGVSKRTKEFARLMGYN